MKYQLQKINVIPLLYQFIRFIGISGIGWLIDFSIYCFLVYALTVPVFWSNVFSAIPAVTLVFIVSTRKIFIKGDSKIPIGLKYALYIVYTLIILVAVSSIGERLYETIMRSRLPSFFHAYSAVLVKCCITGITMICNFFVMKFLAEKI